MVSVHRNTAAHFFTKIRRLIAEYQERKIAAAFDGPVEIDESHLGVGGKRKTSVAKERQEKWHFSTY